MARRLSLLPKILIVMLVVALGSVAVLVAIGVRGFNEMKDSTVTVSTAALEAKTQEHLQRVVVDQARISDQTLEGVEKMLLAQEAQIKDMYAHPQDYKYVPQRIDTSFVGDLAEARPVRAPPDLEYLPLCKCVISRNYINIQGKSGITLSYDKDGNIIANDPVVTQEIRALSPTVDMFKSSYREHGDLIVWNYFGSANGLFYGYPGNGPLPADYDVTQRDWYKVAVAKGGFVWTAPYVDVGGAGLMVTAAKPVYADDGTLLGVIAADVTIETLNKQVINMDIGDTGYAMLVDETGTVLAKPAYEQTDTRWDESFASENLLNSSNAELAAVAKKMVAGEQGNTVLTLNGERKYVVYAPIKGAGWSLAAVLPEKEALAGVENVRGSINDGFRRITTTVMIAILIVVLIVVGVSFAFARNITSPIRKLTEAGNKVADGDLSAEVPEITSNDEIKDLSVTMGLLVGAVKFLKGEQAKAEVKPEAKAKKK